MNAVASFANHRHVLGKFGVPAAGQNGNNYLTGIETVLAAEFLAGLRGLHGADQWMTYEFCGYARSAKERFFKGKNAKGLRESAAHDSDPPRSPCPELRANVVDVADSVRAELAREAEMKAGKIGKDRERRAAALGFGNQPPHSANQRRQVT